MGDGGGFYVELTNRLYRLWQAASASGEYGEYHTWRSGVNYGAGRAAVELIAHVVESDRPYTEILTADYVMANPPAAEAYGAVTEFEDPQNVHEFRQSEIARYYRSDDSKVVESVDGDAGEDRGCRESRHRLSACGCSEHARLSQQVPDYRYEPQPGALAMDLLPLSRPWTWRNRRRGRLIRRR